MGFVLWIPAVCRPLAAQSSALPETRPTMSGTEPAAAGEAETGGFHPAKVTYQDGQLEVIANNSSLNRILREIARAAGMKITGGVKEERVFGSYGPAPAAEVLAALLDGTASNMMLVETAADAPAELILTPRAGGATPPNPNAHSYDDKALEAPAPVFPTPLGRGPGGPGAMPAMRAPRGMTGATAASAINDPQSSSASSPPAGTIPTVDPTTLQPTTGQSGTGQPQTSSGTAPASGSGSGDATPASPNGVKTPQQIFEQLQQLRQQQQKLNQQQGTQPSNL